MAHQHWDWFTINLTFTEQFCSCHQAQNLPGKQRLTGDQRWLGAWHRFCMLSCLNWNLTEGINSCFCPVMLLFAPLRKRELVKAGFTNFVFCTTKGSRHILMGCMQTSIIVLKCQIIMTWNLTTCLRPGWRLQMTSIWATAPKPRDTQYTNKEQNILTCKVGQGQLLHTWLHQILLFCSFPAHFMLINFPLID